MKKKDGHFKIKLDFTTLPEKNLFYKFDEKPKSQKRVIIADTICKVIFWFSLMIFVQAIVFFSIDFENDFSHDYIPVMLMFSVISYVAVTKIAPTDYKIKWIFPISYYAVALFGIYIAVRRLNAEITDDTKILAVMLVVSLFIQYILLVTVHRIHRKKDSDK